MNIEDIRQHVAENPVTMKVMLLVDDSWKEAKSALVSSYEEFCEFLDITNEFIKAGERVVIDTEQDGKPGYRLSEKLVQMLCRPTHGPEAQNTPS